MKPLLLGANNPLSDDPEFDLYPYPEGSTGYRLWKMLPEGTTRRQYLEAFDRLDLLRSRTWDTKAASAAGKVLLPTLAGRYVIVLGTQVRAALGLPPSEPLVWMVTQIRRRDGEDRALHWLPFPHPSGRNRWFYERENRARAEDALSRVYEGVTGIEQVAGASTL